MRIIIAGSRTFTDYKTFCFVCDDIIRKEEWDEVEIVSGGAKGADKMGERFANSSDYKLTVFPADWETNGKKAGYLRNQEMAHYSDALIAFWDGESKGTKHMINIARERALEVYVHKI
jgi:hypothetical protein